MNPLKSLLLGRVWESPGAPSSCNAASEPLAAAVLTEAPPPGAVGQRQQQEEDAAHDEDGARAADARHRPGQLVVEGNRVVAGQEGQDGLVEHDQSDEHQST